jgi:hypothetical protein
LVTGQSVYFNLSHFAGGGMAFSTGMQSGTGNGNGIQVVSAQAAINTYTGDLLHAFAASSNTTAGAYAPAGDASAAAAWRDILFVDGPQHPATVRLVFAVDGLFSGNLMGSYYGVNGVSDVIRIFAGGRVFSDQDFSVLSHPYYPYSGVVAVSTISDQVYNSVSNGFWDTANFAPAPDSGPNAWQFSGTFHIDATFNSTLGGYGWSVFLEAGSTSWGAYGATEFGHTLTLEAVTTTGGAPLSGNLRFDSNLQFGEPPTASVPEPSTLATFAMLFTCVGTFTAGRRHNRREMCRP